MATGDKRQGGQPLVFHYISDTTNIAKLPLKKLLAHTKTKMELTTYLAQKILHAIPEKLCFVVAFGNQCRGTHQDMSHLDSEQEEADTKLLLHSLDVTNSGATSIHICSPDTDVFVLSLRRYHDLCQDTSFVTGTGTKHRVIPLKPIVQAIGESKVAALPAFHALTGADNTGSLAGKGNLTCGKAFKAADHDIIKAMTDLGTNKTPSEVTLAGVEKFVCKIYQLQTSISKVSDLRWWLFKKKQEQSERLPPTPDALRQATLRAHYQLMVWNSDTVANPELPSPDGYGWKLDDEEWVPIMTEQLPAPNAVLHLVKCACAESKCATNRCSCRKAGLNCTDLCSCSDRDDDGCENMEDEHEGVVGD